MRCEPKASGLKQEITPDVARRQSVKPKLAALAAMLLVAMAVGCGGGSSSINPPPPPQATPEWFFVGNFSGNISGFSAASGKLEAIPGSSITFPFQVPSFLTNFAVKPDGTFLAAITVNQQQVATLQIVNIGTGGTLTLAPLTDVAGNPGGMAISSEGVIAITDVGTGTVQLTTVQNNLLFRGASAATGELPQDAVFSSDGSRLYVGNNAGGSISVFAVSGQGAMLQPVQTAQLPVAAGEFPATVVRVTLSASGRKFAATTPDGRLFVGNVSPMDGTLSGFTETNLGANANLEEVVFDPSAQNVYTADQDNGGIFGYAVSAGGVTALPGSPFSTGTLPGGPTGMAFNSAGDRLYAVMQGQAVFTFSRNTSSGQLALAGDVVSSGGFLAGRIVRVPAH
jgi:DNA-binding beta-propeller fold protein YncE